MTRLVFPSDLLNEVTRSLNERRFVVLVAHSGGSKTALATYLEQQQRKLGLTVIRKEVKPDAMPALHNPVDDWPPGKSIREAHALLEEKRITPVVLVLDNVHLDALAFADFWKKWRGTPRDEQPFLVVTSRPHFLRVLAGERELSRKRVDAEEEADTSLEDGLAHVGNAPGFIDLEARRAELFAMHALEAFPVAGQPSRRGFRTPRGSVPSPARQRELAETRTQLLWEACEGSHEGLRLAAKHAKELGPPDRWTVASVTRRLQDAAFEESLDLKRFDGDAPAKRVARERLLELLSHRAVELSMVETTLDRNDPLILRDFAEREGNSVFSPLHPGHARLLLGAARQRAHAGDATLPAWLAPGGSLLEPVLGGFRAHPGGAAASVVRLAARLREEPERVALWGFLAEALALDNPSRESGLNQLVFAATYVIADVTQFGPAPAAVLPRIAKAAVELARASDAPSEDRANARTNAMSALAEPVVFGAVPPGERPELAKWLFDLARRKAPHTGHEENDDNSAKARTNAVSALAEPVVFGAVPPGEQPELAKWLFDLARRKAPHTGREENDDNSAKARTNAVRALVEPVVFGAVPPEEQPELAKWLFDLARRRAPHTGHKENDNNSAKARTNAVLALAKPVVFGAVPPGEQPELAKWLFDLARRKAPHTGDEEDDDNSANARTNAAFSFLAEPAVRALGSNVADWNADARALDALLPGAGFRFRDLASLFGHPSREGLDDEAPGLIANLGAPGLYGAARIARRKPPEVTREQASRVLRCLADPILRDTDERYQSIAREAFRSVQSEREWRAALAILADALAAGAVEDPAEAAAFVVIAVELDAADEALAHLNEAASRRVEHAGALAALAERIRKASSAGPTKE